MLAFGSNSLAASVSKLDCFDLEGSARLVSLASLAKLLLDVLKYIFIANRLLHPFTPAIKSANRAPGRENESLLLTVTASREESFQ